jgi:hypothetical protein
MYLSSKNSLDWSFAKKRGISYSHLFCFVSNLRGCRCLWFQLFVVRERHNFSSW